MSQPLWTWAELCSALGLTETLPGTLRDGGRLCREKGLFQLQAAETVDLPGADKFVGKREPYVRPLVIRKIQVVAAEWRRNPFRHSDERWPLNIDADTRVGRGADDG